MSAIFQIIKENKEKLSNSSLHKALTDKSIATEDKLQCIPAMTMFIMGFKDAMQLIKFDNASTKVEKMINTHANEDSFHWKWFLNDLKYLNPEVIQQEPTAIFAEMYKDEYMPVRDAVYSLMRYIKQYTHPVFRMLILETLENGYELFARDMNPVIEESELYQTLEFFGQKHNQAEEDHEMEHVSNEEQSLETIISTLSKEELKELENMVKDLYDNIYAMHECLASFITGYALA